MGCCDFAAISPSVAFSAATNSWARPRRKSRSAVSLSPATKSSGTPSIAASSALRVGIVKSSQLHSYRLIGRKPFWSRMSSTPSTDVSSDS